MVRLTRRFHAVAAMALATGIAGCAGAPAAAPQGPVTTTIDVVERDWHTDICVRTDDAGPDITVFAAGYDGSRFLCFGFGDRRYVLSRERDTWTMLSALFPGDGAILLTVLRDTPAAAFGAGNVVRLGIDQAGLARLRAFLVGSVQTDGAGAPVHLGKGPYDGGLFLGATATYAGFYTCNTWTAEGLRTAGIPVSGPVLFASGVMTQVRALAETSAAASR
ncbi:DUF2459 domain-containing protein [Cupriavidus pauculus]|uniref:DUF2459 domain-containing protein n=1 Tax=Cupriavidus pauculus TaxID=82633 RepID=UPI001CC32F40|nr:DUF2459 domain-containing protein [Cupriavidus pauculus]